MQQKPKQGMMACNNNINNVRNPIVGRGSGHVITVACHHPVLLYECFLFLHFLALPSLHPFKLFNEKML